MPDPPFILRLLGGAALVAEDVEGGELARQHPIAILALLVTAPSRTRSRAKLVGLLWPDVPERTARNRLNTHLHRIRRRLGDDALVSLGDDVRLNPEVLDSDVRRFEEALEREEPAVAVELYRGPFMEGFHLKGTSEFERWLDRARDRHRRAYLGALETLAEQAEARGASADAVGWWRRRADEDPLDGRVVRRLVEALSIDGNRAEAIRVAEGHARALEQEFGTTPGPELRELYDRLRSEGRPIPIRERPASPVSAHPGERSPGGTERPERVTVGGDGDRTQGRRRWGVIAVAVGLLLGTAGLLYVTDGDRSAPGERTQSVAVLPFRSLGGEGSAVLAEGLRQDLLTRLANVSRLRVVSASTAARLRDASVPLSEIAADLDVRWILDGAVQEDGERIQVNAQLVDPGTDTHRWARSYRRELSAAGVFEIQEEIAASILGALETEIQPAEAERLAWRPTEDLEAFRLYTRGRRGLADRSEVGARQAVRFFREAIERDSGYALAWAGLADAVGLAGEYVWELPGERLPTAEEAARRALAIAPDLAEGRASLGAVLGSHQRDAPGAIRELEKAVELKPSYAQAHHWLGYFLLPFGELDRALYHLRLAVDLDPTLHSARGTLAWALLADDRPDEALEHLRRAADHRSAGGPEDRVYAGQLRDESHALYRLGRYGEAAEKARRGLEHQTGGAPGFSMFLAIAEAAAGDTAAARAGLAWLEEESPNPFYWAPVRAALGDIDGSVEAFANAGFGTPGTVVMLRHWLPEVLDPVRREPRYRDIVREIQRSWSMPATGHFGEGTARP